MLSLVPAGASAAGPIASSSFVGVEDPLSEGGAWAALTSMAPNGGRFQKNNGAYPDMVSTETVGARTTAVVPSDQYSEIVVAHVANQNNVGPTVRVQTSGSAIDSHYVWWASDPTGTSNLFRVEATGTTYHVTQLIPAPAAADGDRLRLVARGQVLYGIQNGVRVFIYNTGPDGLKYSSGQTGMLAHSWADGTAAKIASWSTDAAPVGSGTWASTDFVGVEDPLDEGDRWYPLPGYTGFRKAGGFAIGKDRFHSATGVWGINAPASQYSEITLGTVAGGGGGGPIVRIDRTLSGHSGWLLYLSLETDVASGIYRMNPADGSHTLVRAFSPIIVSGDRWRLAADGNVLSVFQNGVFQFSYTTDGTYPAGDVGMDAFGYTYTHWEGGALGPAPADTTPPTAPANLRATAASASEIDLAWSASTDDTGVTGYSIERCQGSGCTSFAPVTSVSGTTTTYNNTGLAANTPYSYRVRAGDAAGNQGPYSNVASATTQAAPPPPDTTPPMAPTALVAAGTSASQVTLNWTASTDNVGVTLYSIERCQALVCSAFGQVATVPGATTTYNDNGLAAGAQYSYRVRASDAAGNQSAYSNVANATTLVDATLPTAPGNLTATVGVNQSKLTWVASTSNAGISGYLVERCRGVACTEFVQVAVVTDVSFTDTGLASDTYRYRVRAKDSAGKLSAYSSEVTAVLPLL